MQCIRFPGEYKVGRAADPEHRARQMSGGMPCLVTLAKVYEGFGKHENLVHAKLANYMVTSEDKSCSEWFRLPYEELIEKINSVISQFEH